MTQDIFEQTVFIHKDKMYRFAKRILSDEEEAFDLIQEVMLKLWEKRDDLKDVRNVGAFAMRCVRNVAMNKIKKAKVVQLYQKEQVAEVQKEKYPALTTALILELLQELPEKQKLVMHLRDIEEYDVHEIAETLDMAEPAVRVNLMRARQKIKGRLQKLFDYEQRQIKGFGR